MKAIVIDDERPGREFLEGMIRKHCPEVNLVATVSSGEEGIKAILAFDPSLIFLDVEMPGMNGFEMLEKLSEIHSEVIFVTAFDKYALRAIKFSALDYILKPVDQNQLTEAVKKAELRIKHDPTSKKQYSTLFSNLRSLNRTPDNIALPNATGMEFISISNIIRLESNNKQTIFFFTNRPKITVNKVLKEYNEMLGDQFFRSHQSHLINLAHVRKYVKGIGGEIVMSDGTVVELARRKKEQFIQIFSEWRSK